MLAQPRPRAHRHHLRRPRRPARRRRGALGRDHPPGQGRRCPAMTLEVLTGDFKGDTGARRHRARGRAGRLRPQPGDRAAAVAPGPGPGQLPAQLRDPRARAPRAARSPRPGSCSGWARSWPRCTRSCGELARARGRHPDPRPVPARRRPRTCRSRATSTRTSSPSWARFARGLGLPARGGRPAGALLATTPTARPTSCGGSAPRRPPGERRAEPHRGSSGRSGIRLSRRPFAGGTPPGFLRTLWNPALGRPFAGGEPP